MTENEIQIFIEAQSEINKKRLNQLMYLSEKVQALSDFVQMPRNYMSKKKFAAMCKNNTNKVGSNPRLITMDD
jgi:hypothetical protein